MIPKIEPVRHESNLKSATQTFTIEMTPQMAKLLSSQTYTDKVLAAVREPLSNAYDSHVRAGTTRPVDLHLPTPLEPYFAVRDYGTGMSHEKVMSHMFSYGVSDKRDTNTELGGFAIGAKAFYAYTDICTITSWHDGTVRRYAATKDTHGLPQGQLIDEAPTDLPNGVEIRFPVNQGEYGTFINKAQSVLTYLDLPYICNLDDFSINKPVPFFSAEIDGHRIDLLSQGNTKVIMGGIAYAVPNDILWNYAYEKTKQYLNGIQCQIHLPIGSLEIAASRESLSPTEDDKLFIVTLVKKFSDLLRQQNWEDRIDHAENWMAAIQLRDFVAGVLNDNLYYDDKGQRISPEKVLPWRGIPTSGVFCHGGKYPVQMVWNKGRRSPRYAIKSIDTYTVAQSYTYIFWMPTDKKVNWKRWYMDNRDMRYGSSSDHDIFITADTLSEAEYLAKLIGFERPVEDGTKLHTKTTRYTRSKSESTPSPYKGMAWVGERGPSMLNDFEPWQLILSTAENHQTLVNEVYQYNNLRITEKPLAVFRPYGVSEATAVKRFPDAPRSRSEWLTRNANLVDLDKIHRRRLLNEIYNGWKDDWISVYKTEKVPACLDFPEPNVSWVHLPDELSALIDDTYQGAEAEMEAIDEWHKTVFPTLPEEVKNALNGAQTFRYDDLLNLFSTLKTLEV